MLEPAPPSLLQRSSYDTIRYLMLEQRPIYYDDRVIARSFSDNMAKIALSQPEVFLFTHKSAIPLADSVRGYYESKGEEVPAFGIVNTKDEEGANKKYLAGTKEWSQRARSYDSGRQQVIIRREADNLAPLVYGRRIAILDQYIDWRETLNTATLIGMRAGATDIVTPDYATWFHEASELEIDIDTLTSIHEPFMREIGRAAASHQVTVSERL